jgi:hypothetical protein
MVDPALCELFTNIIRDKESCITTSKTWDMNRLFTTRRGKWRRGYRQSIVVPRNR